MKYLKKSLLSLFVVLSILTIAPIINIETPISSSVEASNISLNYKSKTLTVNKSVTLKITGTKKKVTWSSSNKKVATVNSSGKVVAKKKGSATITAKIGNQKFKCKITVKNPKSNSQTVYITRTGSKYHRSSCSYLRRSKIQTTLSSAKSRGYTPCSRCNP